MPAEWEPHTATWLSWPRREGISFPETFDRVLPALRAMVEALIESEQVCINVCNGAHEVEARSVLSGLPMERITFYRVPTNEPWCRDHGPIFLTRDRNPRLAVVDWDYNAWGNKYPPFDLDEVVPTRLAEILKLQVFYPHMILEGGSIDVNGSGALLTSESSRAMRSSYACAIISASARFSGSAMALPVTTPTGTSMTSRGLYPSELS
jgi:agmatine deiminase